MNERPVCEPLCPHKRRLQYSTYFTCLKYGNQILSGNVPKKCDECIADGQTKTKRKKKEKEFIEVK